MSTSSAEVFERLTTAETYDDVEVRLGTACVLGGGVAGLVAACVLARHAERVVIIEPDGPEAASGRATRPGAPQSAQVHLLMPGGRVQLERFIPGCTTHVLAEGAVLCGPERTASYLDDVEQIATPNARFVASSRSLLEAVLRRRTLATPNVELVNGRVTGLRYEAGAVESVCYTNGSARAVAPADFVVDATGRGSRLPDWLERGGWPRPETERLPVDIRYHSACFTRSTDWAGPLAGISRHRPRSSANLAGAAVNAIENQRWAVMLAHSGQSTDGRVPDRFVAQCRELPPIFGEAVRGELVGEIQPYRHPDSRWRHFELLDQFPARLAVVGDAMASFNPVYGQGMSVAALHASCLSEFLCAGPDLDAPARYLLELEQVVVEAAWQTSTAVDAARLGIAVPPTTEQERRRAWALRQVQAAAGKDEQVATSLRAVGFMTAHPTSLMAPELVLRAARLNGVPDQQIRQEFAIPEGT